MTPPGPSRANHSILGYAFGLQLTLAVFDYTHLHPLHSPLCFVFYQFNAIFCACVGANWKTSKPDLSFICPRGIQYYNYFNALPGSIINQLSPYANISLTYRYMDGGSLVFGFKTRAIKAIPEDVRRRETVRYAGSESATVAPNVVPKVDASLAQIDSPPLSPVSKCNISWWNG